MHGFRQPMLGRRAGLRCRRTKASRKRLIFVIKPLGLLALGGAYCAYLLLIGGAYCAWIASACMLTMLTACWSFLEGGGAGWFMHHAAQVRRPIRKPAVKPEPDGRPTCSWWVAMTEHQEEVECANKAQSSVWWFLASNRATSAA